MVKYDKDGPSSRQDHWNINNLFICHCCLISKTNSGFKGLMKYSIIIIIIIIIVIQARPIPVPRRLRRASAAAGLLGLQVRIPPLGTQFCLCDCCVVS